MMSGVLKLLQHSLCSANKKLTEASVFVCLPSKDRMVMLEVKTAASTGKINGSVIKAKN